MDNCLIDKEERMEQLLKELEKAKEQYDCDEMKIYYENPNSYCVKFIKDKEIIARIRKGATRGGKDFPRNFIKNSWGKKTI